MQSMTILIGFFMLALGIMIGLFGKIYLISPANASLFENLSQSAKKKICRKFCVVPLINAVVLISFSVVGTALSFTRNLYLVPLTLLLILSLYDSTRTTTILNKLRMKTFDEKTDL